MSRINRAQSNATEPNGKMPRFSKKLDCAFSIASGLTCQSALRSSSPSNVPGVAAGEYHGLTALFLYFTAVYGWAALYPGS